MKHIASQELHMEERVDIEHSPSNEEPVFSNEDIVGTILSRNDSAKRLLANQLAELGLSGKSISQILNINPKASEK